MRADFILKWTFSVAIAVIFCDISLLPPKALKQNKNDSISLRISRVMDAEGIPYYSNGGVIEVRYCDASLASSQINATSLK